MNIKELRKDIIKHDNLYAKGEPIITDTEYDDLYRKLVKMESEDPNLVIPSSPTQYITPEVVDVINKRKHNTPILSLNDVNDLDLLDKFIKDRSEIIKQYKMDGITIVLTYEDGKLQRAVQRGDGRSGDDVTHNVMQVDNVPKQIPYKGILEVRGEAIIPYADFDKLNVDGKLSNPRNTVSGAMGRHDSNLIKDKGYKIIVFNLEQSEDLHFDKDSEALAFLKNQGFEMVNSEVIKLESESDRIALREKIIDFENNKRKNLPFMIDGLVFKENDIKTRKELGHTNKYPRWAMAYKFKSLTATTKLLAIDFQVGKTGQITPVAKFEEAIIANVKNTSATLSNFNVIKEKDLRIGDTILVERANDVIPAIIKSFPELRNHDVKIVEEPKFCPSCKSETQKIGANLYCFGLECQPQLVGKIRHFASTDAMDIDGLGGKTAKILHEKGIVTSILDIYNLKDKKEDIVILDGFGEASFNRLVKGIEESKKKNLHNLLYSLSISNIGRSASRAIAHKFKTLENILEITKTPEILQQEILDMPDFGEIMTECFMDFITLDENIRTLQTFIDFGLNTKAESIMEVEVDKSSKITGKNFVITGALIKYKNKKEVIADVETLGGKVTGSVTGKTDYLINNNINSTSSKNKKAKDLGIPIISEEEFISMK